MTTVSLGTHGMQGCRAARHAAAYGQASGHQRGSAWRAIALAGIEVGSLIQSKWYAVDVEGVDPNSEINTSDYTYEAGIGYVYFQLSTSDGGDWPPGSYRVELYLDGTKVGEQGFSVR